MPATQPTLDRFLPDDRFAGTLVGRAWRPDADGPSLVALRADGVYDLSRHFATMSALLEDADPQPP